MDVDDFMLSMDWSMSTHSVESYSRDSLDFANWIAQVTNDALEFSTPRIFGNIKKKRTYWWNNDIHQSRRRVIAARRI